MISINCLCLSESGFNQEIFLILSNSVCFTFNSNSTAHTNGCFYSKIFYPGKIFWSVCEAGKISGILHWITHKFLRSLIKKRGRKLAEVVLGDASSLPVPSHWRVCWQLLGESDKTISWAHRFLPRWALRPRISSGPACFPIPSSRVDIPLCYRPSLKQRLTHTFFYFESWKNIFLLTLNLW